MFVIRITWRIRTFWRNAGSSVLIIGSLVLIIGSSVLIIESSVLIIGISVFHLAVPNVTGKC